MTEQQKIESIGLEKCDFEDECDFCKEPSKGSYARIVGIEYRECDYYICGACALAAINDGVEYASDMYPKL